MTKSRPAIKSLDEFYLISCLFRDVFSNHGEVFSTQSQAKLLRKLKLRYDSEGIGFLTQTLPAIGKSLDKALADVKPFSCDRHRLEQAYRGCDGIPRFLQELFERVLLPTGGVRRDACVRSIQSLRQILYLFYKYELAYDTDQIQKVLSAFKTAEEDLLVTDDRLRSTFAAQDHLDSYRAPVISMEAPNIVHACRYYLNRLFDGLDVQAIVPRHGPGAVAQKQQFHGKYQWTAIPDRLTDQYPFDAYFKASLGHVCDSYRDISRVTNGELPARVVLVPKDSRGPRLISCEPACFQWLQQGLRELLYRHVENHPLSQGNVFFTDQTPNQRAALLGSIYGNESSGYATLDLKEASDRVSMELVRAIYPPALVKALEASRSLSTVLPDGSVAVLRKFAPMGSALCFPIMALTIFAILRAVMYAYWDAYGRRENRRNTPMEKAPDGALRPLPLPPAGWMRLAMSQERTRAYCEARATDGVDRILVYGDDVIVPRYFAKTAIAALEFFGLRANLDKCCTRGFFRESCGVDAYKGINVTPLKLRTVWTHHPSAEAYESWIQYTNSFLARGYLETATYCAGRLSALYGSIPSTADAHQPDVVSYPCLLDPLGLTDLGNTGRLRPKVRNCMPYQRMQKRVLVSKPVRFSSKPDDWNHVLRFFTERARVHQDSSPIDPMTAPSGQEPVSVYTAPRSSVLERRWR